MKSVLLVNLCLISSLMSFVAFSFLAQLFVKAAPGVGYSCLILTAVVPGLLLYLAKTIALPDAVLAKVKK